MSSMKSKKIRLVAPAGNFEKLKIAVLYGADEIYGGGLEFNLRIASENFSDYEIKQSVEFCHTHQVKFNYLLNSVMTDQDLKKLPKILQMLNKSFIDAVIISDIGALKIIQNETDCPIYLSTQSSCVNLETALFYQELGIKRIVLGREVSLNEIQKIKQHSGLDIEIFGHGALCMSYSGHCLLSNYTKARDANRGGCSQACRFFYQLDEAKKTLSLLSSKDLSTLPILPEIIDAGVDALKIEGRMKSTLYLSTVVKTYSEAIKAYYQCFPDGIKPPPHFQELNKMPHRTYCFGHLKHRAGEESQLLDNNQNKSQNVKYIGSILKTTEQNIHLHVKNPFLPNDRLEALTFKDANILLDTSTLKNILHAPIQKAKPNSVVILNNNSKLVSPNMIVRGYN